MITWRHFGKPGCRYKQPDITCITADSATVNRAHCTGRSKNNRAPSPATREPHVIQITVVHHTWEAEGRRRETLTWYQPPRDTKTAGAVLGVGHQRQMTPHPPPPAGSDNNSQLSLTLTFLRISLSLNWLRALRASWFVEIVTIFWALMYKSIRQVQN